MKTIKNVFRFLLQKPFVIAIIAFGIVSCNQEELNSNNVDNVVTADLKKGKLDICHYSSDDDQWFVLNVNPNSWAEHSLHGDVRLDDQDGDGKIPYNECGVVGENGTDCNDLDPLNLDGTFCGPITFIDSRTGEVLGEAPVIFEFDESSCSAKAYYNNASCYFETPATLTLIGTSQNTYTYLESDPCDIDGCVVTITNLGDKLEVSFDCEPYPDWLVVNAVVDPPVEEIYCNGIDDDCDGFDAQYEYQFWYLVQDNDQDNWYVELDSYFGPCPPPGFISAEEANQFLFNDCDDTNSDVNPASPEICDDIDNNCDGLLKDRAAVITFQGENYYGAAGFPRFGPGGTVTGEWVDINDTYCTATSDDFTGKIVFIDRGSCNFVDKIKNAQDNGAIGVIICSPFTLGVMAAPPGYDTDQITIPSIVTVSGNCDILQTEAIVSFTVEDSCVEPSGNRTRSSSKSNYKLEFIKTHTLDQKTGELVKTESAQQ